MTTLLSLLGVVVLGIGLLILGGLFVIASPRLQRVKLERRRARRDEAVKERILTERLTRKHAAVIEDVQRRVRSRFQQLRGRLDQGYRRLRLLAQDHRPAASVDDVPKTCAVFLESAQDAMSREAFDDAEERYLACLKVDAKHREAYLGLAVLYRTKKEIALAEETLHFLHRLYPEDADVAMEFAEVLHERGKHEAALKQVRGAVSLAPKNPRYLDFALALALEEGDGRLAKKFFDQLREANPENQKLKEWEKQVKELV